MSVVDKQGVVAGNIYDFHSALNLCFFKTCKNSLPRNAQLEANGYGGHGIINIEFSGDGYIG